MCLVQTSSNGLVSLYYNELFEFLSSHVLAMSFLLTVAKSFHLCTLRTVPETH